MNQPHAAMPCPACAVPLVMSDRQGVEIDYCPQCRGVWLDRGELDKIIERAAKDLAAPAPAPAAAAPPPRDVYQQPVREIYHQPSGYGHGHPKRRKSFLEELFD